MTTSPSPVFLDANVPIYADGAPHRLKEPSIRALERIAEGSLAAITSAEVLQEILHHFIRSGRQERGLPFMQRLRHLVSGVLPVTGDDVLEAARLAVIYSGLPSRDLLHLAVMQRHGLVAILSTDRHFDAVEDIARVDPKDL